jgi:hypothetical protein
VYATSTSALTTGTLPLASGGTGQTTKAAAFNALSPITTTGDLILGNGTNSATRLAIGTNTYVLTSNGSTASWQPAAGGGGGVTSFDAGSTGLNPSGASTGAITLSGTLNTGSGGTGTSSTPSNGQLLIGNGVTYSAATLTAGSGVTITNGSGSITIAASGGGGGPTIETLTLTTSSGTFFNNAPSSTNSAPLIGYNAGSPSNYGAFYFKDSSSGYLIISSPSISQISGSDSTAAPFTYLSGVDFNGTPLGFSVYDSVVTCYGLDIYNAAMQTLFNSSKTAVASPSLKPLDASSGYASTNPWVDIGGAGFSYSNQNGVRGVTVNKAGTDYVINFGSADFTPVSPVTIGSLNITINSGATSSFSPGVDFTQISASNSSSGMFSMQISVINATLTTLLANSFL